MTRTNSTKKSKIAPLANLTPNEKRRLEWVIAIKILSAFSKKLRPSSQIDEIYAELEAKYKLIHISQ